MTRRRREGDAGAGREDPDPPSARARGAPPARPRGALWAVAAGLTAYLASLLLARAPEAVEALYVPRVTAHLISPVSRITGRVPISLAEILVVGYGAWRLWSGLRSAAAIRDAPRRWRRMLRRGGWLLARDAGVVALAFYVFWGFSYARPPLDERIGLPELAGDEAPALLDSLATESTREANRQYRSLHGSEDAGAPTRMPADWRELAPTLERGWEVAARELRLGPEAGLAYGMPKPALLSPVLARLGLAGFYFPFTAEAVANARTPAVALATTLAHEQAHQRGVTDEGEATFLAHLVSGYSGAPLLRYSAAVRAQARLLAALRRRDAERARALEERRLPGVRRDLEDLAAYHRRYRGPARRVAHSVNDAYLRANRVPGGVASYGRVTELLVRYGAFRGGLFPAGSPAADADAGRAPPD